MKIKTEQILVVLKVLAWIAMISYSIEAGSKIISFVVNFINPESVKNLYKGLKLPELRQLNVWYYIQVMSFLIALALMKVHVWSLIIKLLSKLNIENPFTVSVALLLEKIGYAIFGIWVVGMIADGHAEWLSKHTGISIDLMFEGKEFIFMAGIVYIISQVFKRGVELQSENDLTV